jgi:hypothetical protein
LLVGVMVVDSGWFTLGRLAFLAILDDVVAAGQGGTRADGQGVGPAWLARTAQLPQKWRRARADVNDDPIIAGARKDGAGDQDISHRAPRADSGPRPR